MKIKYILAGCFALYLKVKAQNTDSIYKQRLVPKTEIEAVFSYYNQKGEHSAVTGGRGTERLDVYVTGITVSKSFKGYNKISFHGGTDIISSASIDNIDKVVSSASKNDARTFMDISYQRNLKGSNLSIGGGTGFSIESDYFSLPASLALSYKDPSGMRTYDFSFMAYFDDLRWGRLNPDHYKPVKLIYPKELRNTEWFNNYRRNSFNTSFGVTQIVNKRLVVGFFPGIVYQKGLLSTPFHRVYFNNNSVKVENLPSKRLKIPAGFNANYFAANRLILKGGYDFYWDNFGIVAHALKLETAFKVTPLFTVAPFLRLYNQTSSKYFEAYMIHDINENFYTSDYDLADFQSIRTGLNLKYKPNDFLGDNLLFNEIDLRYSYYRRTNALKAHVVSLSFNIETM